MTKLLARDNFGRVNDENLFEEIMAEVENLNQSIKEICPEIISTSKYPSILEKGDLTNQLIERRIDLLTKNSKNLSGSKKP